MRRSSIEQTTLVCFDHWKCIKSGGKIGIQIFVFVAPEQVLQHSRNIHERGSHSAGVIP